MAAEHAAAERIGDGQVAPVAAQVVDAVVVNAPGVDEAAIGAGNAEQRVALILEVRAQGRPAVAEVVGRERPLAARRLVLDAQELDTGRSRASARCRTRGRS